MPQISATAVLNTENFVVKYYGLRVWDNCLINMKTETRSLYDSRLDAREWVDFRLVIDMLKAVKKELGKKDKKVIVHLGEHNAEANLKLTQRIVMKIASVEFSLKMAARLWTGRVKSGGELEIKRTGNKQILSLLKDFPTPKHEWFEYLIGWFSKTIQLSGGRNVQVILEKEAKKKGEICEYKIRWD
jgi:hypothetical protein